MAKKIGLFFGAGAEIPYGLPSGGRFALEIFRQDESQDKELFQAMISNVDRQSDYSRWLPEGYEKKRIWTFGRKEYQSLIESTLEQRKADLIKNLDDFDAVAARCLKQTKFDAVAIAEAVKKITGNDLGERNYEHTIKINAALGATSKLFKAEYFSAFLDVVSNNINSKRLKTIVLAFVQLLVAAHGHTLIDTLTNELFTELPEELGFFDDVAGVFQLDLKDVGARSLDVLLEKEHRTESQLDDEDVDALKTVTDFAEDVLAELLSTSLDYQSVIDEHFRHLYNPSASWAKFTKISIFLFTVRRYISEVALEGNQEKIENGPGYYHDLKRTQELALDLEVVGTSNYNSFIDTCLEEAGLTTQVVRLNGGTSDFYDPWANRLVDDVSDTEDLLEQNRILVPFILTQSGTKPLTSIQMSQRFSGLYDQFAKCDAVAVVGYGFNNDDGHINGIFRELARQGVPVFVFKYASNGLADHEKAKVRRSLRVSPDEKIEVVPINDQRRVGKELWIDWLARHVNT